MAQSSKYTFSRLKSSLELERYSFSRVSSRLLMDAHRVAGRCLTVWQLGRNHSKMFAGVCLLTAELELIIILFTFSSRELLSEKSVRVFVEFTRLISTNHRGRRHHLGCEMKANKKFSSISTLSIAFVLSAIVSCLITRLLPSIVFACTQSRFSSLSRLRESLDEIKLALLIQTQTQTQRN